MPQDGFRNVQRQETEPTPEVYERGIGRNRLIQVQHAAADDAIMPQPLLTEPDINERLFTWFDD